MAIGFVGLAMALSLVFGAAVVPAQAQSTADLQAQIASLLAQIQALQAQLTGAQGGSSSAACGFTRDLTVNVTGADVQCLQKYLNGAGYTVASSGAGSPGSESTFFGSLTRAAVSKWQAANGVSPAAGYFGSISRAKYSSVAGTTGGTTTGGTTTGGTTTPAPSGTGLTVSKPAQPADSLAPESAARIPFTKFTVTAGSDGDVVVNSVTVERTGLAANANFSGIVLLDEDGTQLGTAKTLNSNNQATIGEAVTVKSGTSKTLTIAGNMAADNSTRAGQVATLSVVAVNTSATVSGSLPIVGAAHTVNATLNIGSVTMARGSFDPGAGQTKEVGTTGYTFSSIKVTAGSAEDVYLKSIRWNQTGSAAASSDLTNVKTIVDGTEYATVVSTDGKYYTTNFPDSGLLMQKGFNKDVSIKGDIAGGSNRTVDFDIAKRTDVYLVGKTFGYGVTPPLAGSAASTDGAAFNNADDPYYDAAQVTISTGTMTVSSWTGVSSQNIAVNQASQSLAGFSVDVKGEAISVGGMVFQILAVGDEAENITNITLVDQNGSVIAGPVDGASTATDSAYGTVTFSDTVTFPIGVTNLTMKGKLGTAFISDDTVAASTTPSTQFTTVTGQVTGNTITPNPTSAITGPTMTVKASSLTVSVSSVPIAQTVISGANQFEFARYIFDATASGEDIRITSIPLYFDTNGTRTDLTNCQMYDVATSVTTGSNVKNPATTDTASSTTMTFDGTGLIVSKGTSKTLSLKCNIRSGVTSKYWWGLDNSATMTSASGVNSGQTVVETLTEANGNLMTASAGGTLTVVLDSNSPGYKIASAGSTGVEVARYKFSAASEDIDLRQVTLQLTSYASNTPIDLIGQDLKIYASTDLVNPVGTLNFANNDSATSSTLTNFRVPKDGSKIMVVKADLSAVSASGPLTGSGDLLIVDYDGEFDTSPTSQGTYGTGASSGSTIQSTTLTDTASQGVRIMKSYPVFTHVPLSDTKIEAAEKTLYRFSVRAVGNDVALYKFTFNVGSSTVAATTSDHKLFAYNDSSFSSADTNFSSTGQLNQEIYGGTVRQPHNVLEMYPFKSSATTTYVIGSGDTKYFALKGTFSNLRTTTGSESITISLLGDAAYPVRIPEGATLTRSEGAAHSMGAASAGVDSDTNDDFIWSPVSTTTQNTINDLDFTNGYQVEGLPSDNMTSQSMSHTI